MDDENANDFDEYVLCVCVCIIYKSQLFFKVYV